MRACGGLTSMNTMVIPRVIPGVIPGSKAVLAAMALVSMLVAGCEQAVDPDAPVVIQDAPEALAEQEKYKDFGEYLVHYNALTTDNLPAEVAREYGIARSASQAMLNVVILKKVEGAPDKPVTGAVAASARNLTGQLKSITMREIIEEGGAGIYYIGLIAITDGETLIYTIDVTPINETSRFSAQYQQTFYTR